MLSVIFPTSISLSQAKHHRWKNYHFTLLPSKAQNSLSIIQITEFPRLHKPSNHEASQTKNLSFSHFLTHGQKITILPFSPQEFTLDPQRIPEPLPLSKWCNFRSYAPLSLLTSRNSSQSQHLSRSTTVNFSTKVNPDLRMTIEKALEVHPTSKF